MSTCQFCTSILSTKSALNYHQKHTKKCLKLQGKDSVGKYKCDGCDKSFNAKVTINNHKKICVSVGIDKKCSIIQQELYLALEEVKKYKCGLDGIKPIYGYFISHSSHNKQF